MGRRWTHVELGALLGRAAKALPQRKAPRPSDLDPYHFALLCHECGLPPPVREHRFLPSRQFRWDYAWPDQKIAVEVEGGIWRKGGGAHSHPSNIERDIEKHNLATLHGWRCLRYAPEDLGKAIDDLKQMLWIWP